MTARPGHRLDWGPDINWPAEIQFIRRRLAFQETRAAAAAAAAAWRVAPTDGRTYTYGEIRFSAVDTRRHRGARRLCD